MDEDGAFPTTDIEPEPAAAVILADGPSDSIGLGKAIRGLVERFQESFDPVVVVLPTAHGDAVAGIDLGEAIVTIDEEPAEAASALRVGLDVLSRRGGTERALVTLSSIEGIPNGVERRLLAAEPSRPAIVPRYRYATGYPVIVGRALWERLMALEADQSLLPFLTAHPDMVEEIVIEALPPRPVDVEG